MLFHPWYAPKTHMPKAHRSWFASHGGSGGCHMFNMLDGTAIHSKQVLFSRTKIDGTCIWTLFMSCLATCLKYIFNSSIDFMMFPVFRHGGFNGDKINQLGGGYRQPAGGRKNLGICLFEVQLFSECGRDKATGSERGRMGDHLGSILWNDLNSFGKVQLMMFARSRGLYNRFR